MSSKKYFEQVAEQWDEMRKAFFSEAVREKAYQLAGVKTGQSAADIGAGTGFVTEGLVARGVTVIAVDESEEMMAAMKQRLTQFNTIEYRCGESKALPVADNAVDFSFANMYLHHVEDPGAAIREMARIVKPGGRVILTDLDAHTYDFLRTEHHDRWLGFDREDIRRWFVQAGLSAIQVVGIGQNCCTESCGGEFASIRIFAAVGVKMD